MIQKDAIFEWDLEQEKALQQFQADMQTVLLLGSYDPADLVVFKLLLSDRDVIGIFGRPPIGESQSKLLGF